MGPEATEEDIRSMSEPNEVGSVDDGEDYRPRSGRLWLLAPVLLLGVLVYILLANLADGDDAVGIDFTFGDCPSYAGAGGRDETEELASDPQRFAECEVEVIGTVYEVKDVNLVIVRGPETGERPILLVRGQGGDPIEVAGSDPIEVQGTARASLDAALLAERFDNDPDAYAEFDGEPYVAVKRFSVG
jgi:hypothetical protein